MSAATVPVTRAQTVIQRAYVYAVALVAVHMIVLGIANILRVLAEIALGAPSGGFTGLPFVFADFSRPAHQYREQASLAIALLAVGTPAWWIHFGMAQRAARSIEERASALRSVYIHTVVFVTALLVFGYGQRAARLVLQGTTFGSTPGDSFGVFGLEPEWQARAAGAAAMALAAAVALAFHARLSYRDRQAVTIDGRAAGVRHLAMYSLVVIGFLFAAFSSTQAISDIWRRIADASVAFPPVDRPIPSPPPGVTLPPQPSRDDQLRFELLGAVPAIVAGLALWLGTWLPLQRGITAAPDAEMERRSIIRKLAIYAIVFVSVLSVLVASTTALTAIGRRLLGDPIVEPFTSLWHDLGGSVAGLVIFAPMWIFHRRVVQSEAAREPEVVRAATIRRLYTYLISAIGLAGVAVGAAGTIGVLGSQIMGMNTHAHDETATYISLVLVGGAAWAFHWRTALARLDDDERRSLPRRGYLYLSILGGVLGLLVFGSAALYQLLNGVLAFSFPLSRWHDIWHFVVDSSVAGAVAWSSFRMLRADRAVLGTSADETFAMTIAVRASDRAAARARVAQLIGTDPDITLKS